MELEALLRQASDQLKHNHFGARPLRLPGVRFRLSGLRDECRCLTVPVSVGRLVWVG